MNGSDLINSSMQMGHCQRVLHEPTSYLFTTYYLLIYGHSHTTTELNFGKLPTLVRSHSVSRVLRVRTCLYYFKSMIARCCRKKLNIKYINQYIIFIRLNTGFYHALKV